MNTAEERKAWRPKGWINPLTQAKLVDEARGFYNLSSSYMVASGSNGFICEKLRVTSGREDFEAGADALLSGLLAYLKGLDPQTNVLAVIETLERKS